MAISDPSDRPQAHDVIKLRSSALKERIYVTFTALAVVVALSMDAEHLTLSTAAMTLALTVAGTLLAVLLADVLAHIVVHAALPTASDLYRLGVITGSSVTVLVAPLLGLALSAGGLLNLVWALRISAIGLVLTLVVVGAIATRRLRLPVPARILVLLGEAALGLLVIVIETAAHH